MDYILYTTYSSSPIIEGRNYTSTNTVYTVTFTGAALGVDMSQIAIWPFSYLAAKRLALVGETTTDVTLLGPEEKKVHCMYVCMYV